MLPSCTSVENDLAISGEPTYRFRLRSPRGPLASRAWRVFLVAPLSSSPLLEAFNSAAFIRAEVLDELGHRRLSAFQSVLDVSIAWGAFDGDPDPFRPMSAIHDSCFKTGTPFVLVHSEPHFPTRHGSCRFHVDEHASASRQSVPELVRLSDLTPCVPLTPRRCAGFPSGSHSVRRRRPAGTS